MDRQLVSFSKFLSLVLRHKPETISLRLDENGWANIEELLEAANQHGKLIDRDLLFRVVHENDKQRFAICSQGIKIRASQGHSIDVDLELKPQAPPVHLYHGTVAKFLDSIKKQGLIAGSRQYVHLSANQLTANVVAKRRGKPVILLINAQEMAAAGHLFYRSQNGVWLTSHVLTQYIIFPGN